MATYDKAATREQVASREGVEKNTGRGPKKTAVRARFDDVLGKRALPRELPPWLVINNKVVMRWRGWHHVADIQDEDPFEAAQRLYHRLREARAGRPLRSLVKSGFRRGPA